MTPDIRRQELRRGIQECERAASSLLPLWEKVAAEGCRMRGLSPRIETPHPARTASAPPSPTRGEGKRASCHAHLTSLLCHISAAPLACYAFVCAQQTRFEKGHSVFERSGYRFA